jgi:hypothetical protein
VKFRKRSYVVNPVAANALHPPPTFLAFDYRRLIFDALLAQLLRPVATAKKVPGLLWLL